MEGGTEGENPRDGGKDRSRKGRMDGWTKGEREQKKQRQR